VTALDRLKEHLASRQDGGQNFETPTTDALPKLPEPSGQDSSPDERQSKVYFGSFGRPRVVDIPEFQAASRGTEDALTPELDGEDAESWDAQYPSTAKTAKRLRLTAAAWRQRRWNAAYLREFTPGSDTPAGPCRCGDRVFYKLADASPWRCRSCEPVNARVEIHRWFVASAARVEGVE
jgi:hypothetical protein